MLPLALLNQKYYVCVCVCLNLSNWLADSLYPYWTAAIHPAVNVSRSVNLAESVRVRHSPQEALHSLCCSFHSFCSKCKIRRMRKASDVVSFGYICICRVRYLDKLDILVYDVFSEYCIRLFYHSLSFFWCYLNTYLSFEWELCCASWCLVIVASAGCYQHWFNHRSVHTEL